MGGMGVFKQRLQQPLDHSNEHVNPKQIWRPWENMDLSDETEMSVLQDSYEIVRCDHENCKATFRRESERRRHEESVHCKNVESCEHCVATFTRKDNLTRHIKMKHKHTPNGPPRCPFCNKKLSRQDAVQRHMSTCSRNPLKSQEMSFVHYTKWSEREH